MSKIVVIGDLHLDQSTAGVDRFKDCYDVLMQAVEKAIEVKAAALIFTGDLSDPHTVRSHRAVAALAEAVSRAHHEGIWSVLLAGNHDVIEDGSGGSVMDALGWSGKCTLVKRPSFIPLCDGHKGACCMLLCLPFTPSSHNYDPDEYVRQCAARERPEPGMPLLVIGHLNLEGITAGSETVDMPRGRDVFWPLQALQECFPDALLVGGHYHTAQTFKGVHIVGSAVRLRFDERDNNPGFLVLEV